MQESKDAPCVSIIIPNYNGKDFLETCVNSVLLSGYKDFELIILDDGSTDGSYEFALAKYDSTPRIRVVRNNRNTGAAAARNKAVTLSRGEILVFLDNDTEVEPNWLDELAGLLKNEEVDAAQAKVLLFNERRTIQHAGVSLIPHTALVVPRGGGEVDGGVWDRPDEVLALTTCLAVKKPSFIKVGGFDEKLATHSEDIDFSWRMWLAGCRTVLVPSAKIYHRNKSLRERRMMKATEYGITFSLEKNALRMMMKNLGLGEALLALPIGICTSFSLAVLTFLRTRSSTRLRAFLNALAWNTKQLDDTMGERIRIQRSLRKLSDRQVFDIVLDKRSFARHVAEFLGISSPDGTQLKEASSP